MSIQKFTPPVAALYFEIHYDGTHFRLFDLGTSRRSQSLGNPQYTADRFETLADAERQAAAQAHDRGDL